MEEYVVKMKLSEAVTKEYEQCEAVIGKGGNGVTMQKAEDIKCNSCKWRCYTLTFLVLNMTKIDKNLAKIFEE